MVENSDPNEGARGTMREFPRVAILVLSVVVALWIRSYLSCDELILTIQPTRYFRTTVSEGLVALQLQRYPFALDQHRVSIISTRAKNLDYLWIEQIDRGPDWLWSFQAFTGLHVPKFGSLPKVAIPLWLFAVIPIVTIARGVACVHRARREGLCQDCGYDLRASPDRCPECGQKRNSNA